MSDNNEQEVVHPYKPHYQQRIAHECKAKFILFGGAVGGGKSAWLVNDALAYALGWKGNVVGIFRWENTTFRKTTYPEMEKFIMSVTGLVAKHDKNNREVTLVNGSKIIYGGLKPSSSASGDLFSVLRSLQLGEGYVDEVTDMPERAFRFLAATRLRRIKATNIQTGQIEHPPFRIGVTSNPEPGWVKQEWIDRRSPDHAFIQSKASDNPHNASDYVTTMREQFGHIEGWYEKYVEGRWDMATVVDAIWPADLLEQAKMQILEPGEPVEFGVDPAGEGDDKTVVIMRRGYKVTVLLMEGKSTPVGVADAVALLADEWRPSIIRVDAIGEGKGVWDILSNRGYPAEKFIAGEAADDPEMFANRRAEAYWRVYELLLAGKLDLPSDCPELYTEGGAIKRYQQGARTVRVEKKENIKKRLGHSPDYADALVMCMYGEIGEGGGAVAVAV